MTIAYGDRDFTSAEWGAINRRNFYAKRFARLAPLYYFSLVVSRNYILEWPEASPSHFLTLFCVQTWTGYPGLWNGVLWSVSTIAYFYYRFPWIISRVKRLVAKYDVQRVVIALGLINILKYSLFFLPWDLSESVYWYARAFPPSPCPLCSSVWSWGCGEQAPQICAPLPRLWAIRMVLCQSRPPKRNCGSGASGCAAPMGSAPG